jgi:osmoprotectant transport system permease protein
MNLFAATWAWLVDPANWGEGGIPARLLQHVAITVVVVVVAAVIALPVGLIVGHRRRGASWVIGVAGIGRAIPTLGLLTLCALALGIGLAAPIIALVLLAIPPLLASTYAGVASIDPAIPGAARAIGMSPSQVVTTVELPIASGPILGGFRSATLQVVATATLAAYVADAGLGRFIMSGLKSRNYPEMLGGSILVVILALVLDGAFVLAIRLGRARRGRPSSQPIERTA